MEAHTTVTGIKNTASKLLLQFQTGKITKDDLYREGFSLTIAFNSVVDSGVVDYKEAEATADLLNVIKHFATC